MEVIREDNGHEGAFKAINLEIEIAEMTYIWNGKDKIIIDHTEVNPEFEGQGVGKNLFVHAVDFARKNNVKIVPVCPFVAALCQRDPDVKDVLANY